MVEKIQPSYREDFEREEYLYEEIIISDIFGENWNKVSGASKKYSF